MTDFTEETPEEHDEFECLEMLEQVRDRMKEKDDD